MVGITVVITGQPYVKKNNQKVAFARNGRKVKYNTPSYNRWHTDALEQLAEMGFDVTFKEANKYLKQAGQPLKEALISYPINLACKFFVKSNGRVDLSALYEGIQDVLVEVGILDDDNWHVVASHDGSGVWKDASAPRMEITITPKET
jgi:hypothetical protein